MSDSDVTGTDATRAGSVALEPAPGKPLSRTYRLLRERALEVILFAGTTGFLLFATVATVWTALNGAAHTEDLSFPATSRELARSLEINGPDRIARLVPATLSVGPRTIRVDTLATVADSTTEPAVSRGGFIADQIELFNDHEVRRALLSATLTGPRRTSAAAGPSLLRTVWTEDGERRLSETPNRYALTVRSPYAERSWREVRTADWQRSAGLLGLEGDITLAPELPNQSRARINGGDCTLRNVSPRILFYCSSPLAADASRFFDFGFELRPGVSPVRVTNAFSYRQRDQWRNGRTESFGTLPVNAGDVFDVRWLGPFVLSVLDRGTLAAGQWINGRLSFNNQHLGTISFFAAAGRATPSAANAAPLVLALDAGLSQELDREAVRFLAAHDGLLARMSLVILDLRSGEVKAIVEPGRTGDGEALLAFQPLLLGSVVKPMVASAILARQPTLGRMSVPWAGDTVRMVANIPLQRGFGNDLNRCGDTIDFDAFIRCSSNQYAAELLVRSLQADGYRHAGENNSVVPRAVLERSSIGTGLAEAFDVDAFGQRTAGRNPALWGAGTANRTLIPWESRPWLLFPNTDGTRLDLLTRYAFGGWENRWTPLSVAEAYARIATGRAVASTIFSQPMASGLVSPFPAAEAHIAAAFARVRGALRQVGETGTASGLGTVLTGAARGEVAVLAKTGTLNEETGRFKSLALAVGTPVGTGPAAPLSCGLVVVTYFEFADDARARGLERLPPVHIEFARGNFARVLSSQWERVSGCAPGSSTTKRAERRDSAATDGAEEGAR